MHNPQIITAARATALERERRDRLNKALGRLALAVDAAYGTVHDWADAVTLAAVRRHHGEGVTRLSADDPSHAAAVETAALLGKLAGHVGSELARARRLIDQSAGIAPTPGSER
jgi:hypothetical protein